MRVFASRRSSTKLKRASLSLSLSQEAGLVASDVVVVVVVEPLPTMSTTMHWDQTRLNQPSCVV